jgi:hypothetical protein
MDTTNIRFVSAAMMDAILRYAVSWVMVDRYHPSSPLSDGSVLKSAMVYH